MTCNYTKPSGIRHNLLQNEEGKFMCPYCDYTTVRKNTCSEHVSQKHCEIAGRSLLPNKCPYCPEMFQRKSPMYQHIKSRHEIVYETCFCGLQFKNRNTLHAHHVRVHMDTPSLYCLDVKDFKCKSCDKVMSKAAFFYHAAKCFQSSPYYEVKEKRGALV